MGGWETQKDNQYLKEKVALKVTAADIKEVIYSEQVYPGSLRCPKPVYALAQYLHKKCPKFKKDSTQLQDGPDAHANQKAIAWYQENFTPGTFCFKVPLDARMQGQTPDPLYHSIEGYEIYIARWELAMPGFDLCCPREGCAGKLCRQQMKLDRSCTNIIGLESDTVGRVAFHQPYSCNKCYAILRSNSGELINSLPVFLQRAYPVEARFAAPTGQKHLHWSLSRLIESLGITYLNGEAISRYLYQGTGDSASDRVLDFYSQLNVFGDSGNGGMNLAYPSSDELSKGCLPPEGSKLWETYTEAQHSDHTISHISEFDRGRREIQGVGSSVSFVHDHTHETLKNYGNIPGAKALWTTMVETGESTGVFVVGSTAIADYAHAAEQIARRPNMKPKGMWSDIYPNGMDFWRLLWPAILGHLGLFHWLKRISSTLRQRHVDYKKALLALSMCVYAWHADDLNGVIQALLNGALGGHKHSDHEITELRSNGKFKSRYAEYIKKVFHPPETINANLDKWWRDYLVNASQGMPAGGGRRDPKTNDTLFTPETRNAVENGKKTLPYVVSQISEDDMYRQYNAAPRAKHSLPTYRTQTGESNLENLHNYMADWGNCGMNMELSDTINIAGLAQHNARCREKIRVGMLPSSEVEKIPSRFRGMPLHRNHSKLAVGNALAAKVGAETVYSDLVELGPDTGEQFFGQYFKEQEQRKRTSLPHPLNNRCQCNLCALNPTPFPPVESDATVQAESGTTESGETDHGSTILFPMEEQEPIGRQSPFDHTPIANAAPFQFSAPMSTQVQPFVPPSPWFSSGAAMPHFPPGAFPYQPPPPNFYVPFASMPTPGYYPVATPTPAQARPRKKRELAGWCCEKFFDWHQSLEAKGRHAGRPPHAKDCPFKSNKRVTPSNTL